MSLTGKIFRTFASLATAVAVAASSHAAVVFDNGASNPSNFGAYFSAGNQWLADDITLGSATTLRSTVFWGGHWSSGVEPATEGFTFNVYGSGGVPGALLGSSALQLVSKIDTGFDHNLLVGANILKFTMDLATPIALSGGSYWVSIVSQLNPGTTFFWQETGTDSGPGLWALSSDSGASWSANSNVGQEKAFNLSDSFAGAVAVPEPGTLVLAALALLGLAVSGRRNAPRAR